MSSNYMSMCTWYVETLLSFGAQCSCKFIQAACEGGGGGAIGGVGEASRVAHTVVSGCRWGCGDQVG